MSLVGYSDPLEHLFGRGFPFNFLSDFEDLNREMTPYWNGKRGLLEFGKDEMKSTDNQISINVDVSSFHPSELNVSVEGKDLVVKGCHEESSDHSSIQRHFVRRYRIPDDMDPSQIKSSLSQDGKLTVEVPKRNEAIRDNRQIPIQFTK